MKKKIVIAMLALGTLILLHAQPQMPHYEFFNGPWSARKIVDMGLCYVGNVPPYPPPVIYAVNEDTCLAKTTDDGETWEILPKGHNFEDSIKCVAVHSLNPNIVYKGVTGNKGETGIMRSTDGGQTWESFTDPDLPNHITPSKLGIFRQNPDYLLLGMRGPQTGSSLYRTTNSGSDWSPVNQWDPYYLDITDFSFHPTIPEVVCFSTNNSPYSDYRGIWLSSDFGVTWQHIGRPDNMEHAEITCVAMVDEDLIYAGYWYQYTGGTYPNQYPYGDGRILKTTDGGNSWVPTAAPIFHFPPKDIVIDESDPIIFYVCYGDFMEGSYYSGMDAVGILRFENYGSSWSYHNNNLSDLFVYSLQTNKNNPNCLFAGTRHSFYRRGGGPTYEWDEKAEGMLKSWNFCISPHLPVIYSFPRGALHTSTDCGNSWCYVPGEMGEKGEYEALNNYINY